MEFGGGSKTSSGPRKKLNHVTIEYEEARKKEYSIPMNLYAMPPLGKLDLCDAEHLVEERIKLLRVFDSKPVLTGPDWNANLKNSMKSLLHAVPGLGRGRQFLRHR